MNDQTRPSPEYMHVTRELIQGLYEDLERAVPEMPCLKSDAGARRNLMRLILLRKPSAHVRPIPTTTEELAAQAKATADRLRHAERLLRRCQPLIVEGGRYIEVGSVTDSVERFLTNESLGGEV